jgi:hypothetical protein
MAKYTRRIEELSALINQAIVDDVMAIECDSTWESGYYFKSLELQKFRVKLVYDEYCGKENVIEYTSIKDDQDLRYHLTWIKKCINKGYRDAAKELARDKKLNPCDHCDLIQTCDNCSSFINN